MFWGAGFLGSGQRKEVGTSGRLVYLFDARVFFEGEGFWFLLSLLVFFPGGVNPNDFFAKGFFRDVFFFPIF